MSDYVNETELAICMGVQKTPGDADSAEQGVQELSLMEGVRGFAVASGGWTPGRAQTKAQWVDTPLMEGRLPSTFSEQNVTETIQLTATAASLQNRDWLLSELARYRKAAQEFHTGSQIEPVYLRWKAAGASGPQYALIFNMDVAGGSERFESAQTMTITVTIEREPDWRWEVSPGGNPKIWTAYKNGSAYDTTNASLITGTDHLSYAVIDNVAALGLSPSVDNFIDIPAEDIPGDAPALVEVSVNHVNVSLEHNACFIAVTQGEPTSGILTQSRMLNAANASSGVDASKANDTGGAPLDTIGTRQRGEVTFATSTLQNRFSWTIRDELIRGRYLIFGRMRLSAVASVLMQVQASSGWLSDTIQLTSVGSGGTGTTAYWKLCYFGVANFPPMPYPSAHAEGTGIDYNGYSQSIKLYASRSSGTGLLYVCDLILIPIHECATLVRSDDLGKILSGENAVIYDSTGHLARGNKDDTAVYYSTYAGAFPQGSGILEGQPITLKPGVPNRVHFLTFNSIDMTCFAESATVSDVTTVRLNIVPRSIGVRSE